MTYYFEFSKPGMDSPPFIHWKKNYNNSLFVKNANSQYHVKSLYEICTNVFDDCTHKECRRSLKGESRASLLDQLSRVPMYRAFPKDNA